MICVECGAPVAHLYREFSKGNIRLTQCKNCNLVADKYVEYELLLIVLDLILHKQEAYRHVLINRVQWQKDKPAIMRALVKLIPVYLLLDVYVKWSRMQSEYTLDKHATYMLELQQAGLPRPWERHAFLVFLSCMELLVYILGIFLALAVAKYIQRVVVKPHSWNQIVCAILLSSFGRLFVVLMIIWDYDLSFGRVIDLMVITSHITALTVLLELSTSQSAMIVIMSFFVRVLFSVGMCVWDHSLYILI